MVVGLWNGAEKIRRLDEVARFLLHKLELRVACLVSLNCLTEIPQITSEITQKITHFQKNRTDQPQVKNRKEYGDDSLVPGGQTGKHTFKTPASMQHAQFVGGTLTPKIPGDRQRAFWEGG